MPARIAIDTAEPPRSECWCCGAIADPSEMIHLGNHPEVGLCIRCGHWAGKQAWQLEDRTKTGALVLVRDRFRAVRRHVVRRGWHRSPVIGSALRRLGKWLP